MEKKREIELMERVSQIQNSDSIKNYLGMEHDIGSDCEEKRKKK